MLLLFNDSGGTDVRAVLSAAGRAFLLAFAASIVLLAPGVLAAPNLNESFALGVAALFASVAAGLRVLTAYVPQLSFKAYLPDPYGAWVDAAFHAFAGALVISLPGVLDAPNLGTARALGLAAILAALTAVFRALSGLLTPGENPAPATGVKTPPNP